MNRRIATFIAAGAAGAFAFALPLRALPPTVRDTYNTSNESKNFCSADHGNSLTFVAPADLWPPNHKYYTNIHVKAVDADGEPITLTSDGTHNQYDGDTADSEAKGSGNTVGDDIVENDSGDIEATGSTETKPVAIEKGAANADGASSVTTDWKARAERAGTVSEPVGEATRAGRTYTLHAVAQFGDEKCEGSVEMFVPHDMSPKNR